jgi:hypothetical protein
MSDDGIVPTASVPMSWQVTHLVCGEKGHTTQAYDKAVHNNILIVTEAFVAHLLDHGTVPSSSMISEFAWAPPEWYQCAMCMFGLGAGRLACMRLCVHFGA